ncbi:MAG: hypothetical protein PV362_16950, partial [Providencia heimbachae]|nr:hypothetical protein [Providencia heimbachae]
RLKNVSLILFYVEWLLLSSLSGEPLALPTLTLKKGSLIRMKIAPQRSTTPSLVKLFKKAQVLLIYKI